MDSCGRIILPWLLDIALSDTELETVREYEICIGNIVVLVYSSNGNYISDSSADGNCLDKWLFLLRLGEVERSLWNTGQCYTNYKKEPQLNG